MPIVIIRKRRSPRPVDGPDAPVGPTALRNGVPIEPERECFIQATRSLTPLCEREQLVDKVFGGKKAA